MTDTQTAAVWDAVHALAAWLGHGPRDHATEAALALLCLKPAEEAGEVAGAVIGVMGQNPRKGTTHTWDDVAAELCDTALAALVALTALVPDPQGWFEQHAAKVAVRAGVGGGA